MRPDPRPLRDESRALQSRSPGAPGPGWFPLECFPADGPTRRAYRRALVRRAEIAPPIAGDRPPILRRKLHAAPDPAYGPLRVPRRLGCFAEGRSPKQPFATTPVWRPKLGRRLEY